MKLTYLPAIVSLLLLSVHSPASSPPTTTGPSGGVNAAVGDASWIAEHGTPPGSSAPEVEKWR